MNREDAIRKLEFSKKAYQTLIDEKVDSGKLVGKDVKGEWKANTPLDEAYKSMIDALEIAIKALEHPEQNVIAVVPCGDVISRQAALNMQYRIDDSATLSTRDVINVDDIEALPPVTAEQKTAYWVEENIDKWSRKIFCSGCGCPPPFEYVSDGDVYSANGYGVINKTKFCPNCGAKMEVE